jgi:acyl-[acyl-carrier-protein] desaturase
MKIDSKATSRKSCADLSAQGCQTPDNMIEPDATIVQEIEEQRPRFPIGLLSHQEKDRLIERGLVGLYRWYLARSQAQRDWNPDRSFNWRGLRTDHSPEVSTIVEGFFAIEHYIPDYISKTVAQVRQSYGRSHFQIRWGAEEEKHADLWQNTLLFSRFRTPQWIENYKHLLQTNEWRLPWEDALHMTCYVVLQERVTQLSYLNTALIARGENPNPEFANDTDPVLAHVAQTIAADEAAHYAFFLEVVRLYLYYYPALTLEALVQVIKHFAMVGIELVPDQPHFYDIIYRAGIYGPRQHMRDILQVALNNLGIASRKALEEGVRRFRRAPDADGNLRDTTLFESFDYRAVQDAVRRLFGRIQQYEQEIGLDQIDPTSFVPSGLAPI